MTKLSVTRSNLDLWGTWQLPTLPVLEVLTHLIQPGEPRLYVQTLGTGVVRSSLTNSETVAGRSTQIDSLSVISANLVDLDSEATEKCASQIKAYKISQKGREALAQFHTDRAYRELVRKMVPRLLKQQRCIFGVVPIKRSRNR